MPLLAAACGSSGSASPRTQVVEAAGFRYAAPAEWRVRRSEARIAAESDGNPPARVSAAVYRLAKPYTPDRFDDATRELDRLAAKLAEAAGGAVKASRTTTIAGRRVRAYRFSARRAGAPYEDRVGFVLDARREVQLLCQMPAGAGDVDGACELLFSSFELR